MRPLTVRIGVLGNDCWVEKELRFDALEKAKALTSGPKRYVYCFARRLTTHCLDKTIALTGVSIGIH